ncbi:hypothetical protein DQX05_26060 [Paenibacillus thiaminolyticus]|uniref:Uncharacterized protein n=1 Tax=Paenibacillus thiaminolyticus TaxID=49283 RepID=A0A3A3GAH8_PANTH|nr:hypothetical protein DQX05_26060 [Paenibacillus thiaminolyticus]
MNKMNKISIARAQRIGYGACELSIILWVLLADAYRLRLEFPVQHVNDAESGCFFVVRRY